MAVLMQSVALEAEPLEEATEFAGAIRDWGSPLATTWEEVEFANRYWPLAEELPRDAIFQPERSEGHGALLEWRVMSWLDTARSTIAACGPGREKDPRYADTEIGIAERHLDELDEAARDYPAFLERSEKAHSALEEYGIPIRLEVLAQTADRGEVNVFVRTARNLEGALTREGGQISEDFKHLVQGYQKAALENRLQYLEENSTGGSVSLAFKPFLELHAHCLAMGWEPDNFEERVRDVMREVALERLSDFEEVYHRSQRRMVGRFLKALEREPSIFPAEYSDHNLLTTLKVHTGIGRPSMWETYQESMAGCGYMIPEFEGYSFGSGVSGPVHASGET